MASLVSLIASQTVVSPLEIATLMGTVSSPTFFTSPRKGFSVTYTKLSTEFYHVASVWDDTDNHSVSVDEVDPYTTPDTVYFYFDWQSGHAYHGIVNFSSPSHGPGGPAPISAVGAESRGKSAAQKTKAAPKKKKGKGPAPDAKA